MNIKNIELAMKQSKKTKTLVSEECGFARTTLDAILRGSDVGLAKVEKLAEVLNVPVSYFFQSEEAPVPKCIEGANAAVTERIKHLEEKLADKERIIADKERIIELLSKQK